MWAHFEIIISLQTSKWVDWLDDNNKIYNNIIAMVVA